MATQRRTLEQRILDRQARIEAEQKEIKRLREIEDNAISRAEWVADLFVEHGVEALPKDRNEAARLGKLLDTIKASAPPTEDVEKLKERARRLEQAVLRMARDVGIQGADQNAVWAQIKERYQLQ